MYALSRGFEGSHSTWRIGMVKQQTIHKYRDENYIAGLPEVQLPPRYNYVAAFLTLSCRMNCFYCITRFGRQNHISSIYQHEMSGADWISGLSRLKLPANLPITLQGGEPSSHPDFYSIINALPTETSIDILTNLDFDLNSFIDRVDPARIRRNAPYASLRVSYHPLSMDLSTLVAKVVFLRDRGYSIGVWGIRHPDYLAEIASAQEQFAKVGIDFRTKEFLGLYNGRLIGSYKYQDAVNSPDQQDVYCRTSELIIGPSGYIFRCHSDLYNGRKPIGHIHDERLVVEDRFLPCENYGTCNPCDIKIKTNRFQQQGHTSVEIHLRHHE